MSSADVAARSRSGPAPLIFLVAGEPSGDLLGARLMAALKRRTGGAVQFAGVGGDRMVREGLASLFPLADLAIFGLAEVLPRLPRLVRRLRETAQSVEQLRPDAVVTIDAPDFCFRVVKRLRGRAIPLIHYVAPTVWAWRPGRARALARTLDHLLALLPFEPPYFEREGLACSFVGHPIVEGGAGRGEGARFRAAHGIAKDAVIVTVLPGSRAGEVSRLLGDFQGALERLAPSRPGMVAAVPTIPAVADAVGAAIRHWPVRSILVHGDADKYDAFAASTTALAASGTVALELALAGLPAVIAYRIHPVAAALYRPMINARFVNLVNIMHDRMVVPELLQADCRPDRLASAMARLLDDPAARRMQRDALAEVAAWLGRGGVAPSERAADVVLSVVARAGVPPHVSSSSAR